LHGVTLSSPRKRLDTTPVIINRVSIITIWSSLWGENQAATFVGKKVNPALHDILAGEGKDIAQIVRVNVETNWLKALLIRLFMWSLRRKMGKEEWGRYFLVRKGLNDEVRGAIAAVNGSVGYVYLADWDGRIRWAGCGNAAEGEVEGLNVGVRKLVEQWKTRRKGGDGLIVSVKAAVKAGEIEKSS
jgi:mitochondrial ATPase complex subunit ATP10